MPTNGHSSDEKMRPPSPAPAEEVKPRSENPTMPRRSHPWPRVALHPKETLAAVQASLYNGYQRLLLAEDRTEWWEERQAVVDVHLGIEVLLKERLAEINPLLVAEKVTEQVLLEDVRRARAGQPPTPWYDKTERTVGFTVVLARMAQLSEVTARHRQSLDQLNALRNRVAHTGLTHVTQVRALLIVDVAAFLDEFLIVEFNSNASAFFGDELWRQVTASAAGVDDEFSRAVHRKIARSREPLGIDAASFQPRFEALDLERLHRSGGLWFETTCPGCGGQANAALVWDSKRDAAGQPIVKADGHVVPAFWPYISRLECGHCDLELEGRELNDYLELADEELANHFGPDWRKELTRN
jgi:hypothetical protein